ncbi:beta-glucosidase family protein [Paraglaciecola sp.]|uniref:beta-glucosidase n=1 Tax=Paraglaciecola sp. TaxID=1920173 RepID=UPI003EF86608
MKIPHLIKHKFITGGLLISASLLLNGCAFNKDQPTYKDPSIPTAKRVEDLVSRMTIEEKVAQLGGMADKGEEFGDYDATNFGTKGNERLGIPTLNMGHGITGVRAGRNPEVKATYFATPIALASTWDAELYGRVGGAIAKELRAADQHLNLGPTLNIIRHPLGGRNWESLSEDPFLTGELIVPYIKQQQANGVIAGPKHYAVNNQENNRFDINNVVDERTLREIYLPGFKAAFTKGGAMNAMCAYVRLNGEFACENKWLLTDVLRNDWGFKGFVLSDFALAVHSTKPSIDAGLNVEMHKTIYYGDNLLQAVKSGEIAESRINELVSEKLYTMFKIGMFDNKHNQPKSVIHSQEHQDIALEVARSAPILLKNNANLLPLNTNNIKSVAVIGPNAKRYPDVPISDVRYAYYMQGGGSGRNWYIPDAMVSPYQGIKNLLPKSIKINYAQGAVTPNIKHNRPERARLDEQLIAEAVKVAKQSEVAILVVGMSGYNETEGRDRKTTLLPGRQNDLIKAVLAANPNTVVVNIAGAYVDVSPWVDNADTLLFAPYAGEKIGHGLAEVLFGQTNPNGKLTFSYPRTDDLYPEDSIFNGGDYKETKQSNVYTDGIFVGYRYFEKQKKDVLFPFGYGLSYSDFAYQNLTVIPINQEKYEYKVIFKLSNLSDVSGSEIAQLYIRDPKSSIARPVKELKGFKKISLDKNETKVIEISLDKDTFAFFDVQSQKWVVEPGQFDILIGSSSQDIKLQRSIYLR